MITKNPVLHCEGISRESFGVGIWWGIDEVRRLMSLGIHEYVTTNYWMRVPDKCRDVLNGLFVVATLFSVAPLQVLL